MQLGLIGLGKMGHNMLLRLREGGHEVIGYDHNPQVSEVADLPGLAGRAELLRISPQGAHSLEIVRLFRTALEGRLTPAAALDASRDYMPEAPCNGFWHGRPGVEQYVAA